MNYFVTGTDTAVGKTYVTALLARAFRKIGFDTVALKPACCGSREDVEILREACGSELSHEEINPYWFQAAAAPLIAARLENREVDWPTLEKWFTATRSHRQSVLVEGAGGWLVPVAPGKTVADLAVLFNLPVLVVVSNRLGCLNHTLLTVESIRARGLTCAGLALNNLTWENDNDIAASTNKDMLQEICDAPILYEIHPGQDKIEMGVELAE